MFKNRTKPYRPIWIWDFFFFSIGLRSCSGQAGGLLSRGTSAVPVTLLPKRKCIVHHWGCGCQQVGPAGRLWFPRWWWDLVSGKVPGYPNHGSQQKLALRIPPWLQPWQQGHLGWLTMLPFSWYRAKISGSHPAVQSLSKCFVRKTG